MTVTPAELYEIDAQASAADIPRLISALREAWKERDAARAEGAKQMRERAVSLCRGRAAGHDVWNRERGEAMKCSNAIESLALLDAPTSHPAETSGT